MKILLISIGTRGDMEPFAAVGEILKAGGHQVICAFPEQFRNIAEETGLQFASLGEDYIHMLESDLGKAAMGGSPSGLQQFITNIKLSQQQNEITKDLVLQQYKILEQEQPDRVIYNGKATVPILWGLHHPEKHFLLCPQPYIHYTKGSSHVAFHTDLGPFLNKLSYKLVNFGTAITLRISTRWLALPQMPSLKTLQEGYRTNNAIYTISPTIFPQPEYWPPNLKVLGYHQRKPHTNWQPDKSTKAFLEKYKHARILFITFGSMINPAPEEKTRMLMNIVEKHNIPTIINTYSCGLKKPTGYTSSLVHFVSHIPYDWIFPKLYAVIHHGGSGTTHMALKSGCASMVIPHIADQFIWDKIVAEKGAGPEGIPITKLAESKLETKILDLIHNDKYKTHAEQIAIQMAHEDNKKALYEFIIAD